MNSIISAVLVLAYLAVLFSGWGILGYAYYRLLRGMTDIQSRNRGLATCLLGLVIGIPLDKSVSLPSEPTPSAIILRSVAYAWWAVPYALAIAIVVMDKRRRKRDGPANQAL